MKIIKLIFFLIFPVKWLFDVPSGVVEHLKGAFTLYFSFSLLLPVVATLALFVVGIANNDFTTIIKLWKHFYLGHIGDIPSYRFHLAFLFLCFLFEFTAERYKNY